MVVFVFNLFHNIRAGDEIRWDKSRNAELTPALTFLCDGLWLDNHLLTVKQFHAAHCKHEEVGQYHNI